MDVSTDHTAETILLELARALDLTIGFVPDATGRVQPQVDMTALLARILALLVYQGVSVPTTIAPPYNAVHAEIAYWTTRLTPTTPPAMDGPAMPTG